MSRPRAETMPAVTVPPRPNGLPTASTQSPTRGGVSGKLDEGEVVAAVDLDQREIGARIGADDLGGVGLAVVGRDLDAVGLLDDVVVGDGVAVGRDEEARALGLAEARGRAACLRLAFGHAEALEEFSIGEPFGNGSSSPLSEVCVSVRILTRTEITAGFTFSTMSAKPAGRATCCASCDRFCAWA